MYFSPLDSVFWEFIVTIDHTSIAKIPIFLGEGNYIKNKIQKHYASGIINQGVYIICVALFLVP